METDNYRTVRLENLASNTLLPFPLFICHRSAYSSLFNTLLALYKPANSPFREDDRKSLSQNSVTELCIRQEDTPLYNEYRENLMSAILADNSIPVSVRGGVLFETAYNFSEELFDNALLAGEKLDRCRRLVEEIADFLFLSADAITSFAPQIVHDNHTCMHSVQVAAITIALCTEAFRPPWAETVDIGMGALLHDFGKSFIPRKLLEKKGKLSNGEWKIMKEHPAAAYNYLKKSSELSETSLTIVLRHHEKWNGAGYPYGLSQDRIGQIASAAAVADIYSALTARRPYRGPMPPIEAIRLMREEMADALDSDMMQRLPAILRMGGYPQEASASGAA